MKGHRDELLGAHKRREIVFPKGALVKERVLDVLQTTLVDGGQTQVRAAIDALVARFQGVEDASFEGLESLRMVLWNMRVKECSKEEPEYSYAVDVLCEAVNRVVADVMSLGLDVDEDEGGAAHFAQFETIGGDHTFKTPHGTKKLLYFDWTAGGRLSPDVEDFMLNEVGPWVANTHTETSEGGKRMTAFYEQARLITKRHIGANEDDVLLFAGQGMTGAVAKLQDILGIREKSVTERIQDVIGSFGVQHTDFILKALLSRIGEVETVNRPVVFVTRLEHHSNDITWREANCEVVHIPNGEDGLPDLQALSDLCVQYQGRKLIGAFTAASNVTGVVTPYNQMAKLMHQNGGLCFVDFAASAPYTEIDMHPSDEQEALDAVYFSPHKMIGGPGSSGVLAFNKNLYNRDVPTVPGGGTVNWTSPIDQRFIGNETVAQIEAREDGGTPAIMQGIRVGQAILLKERMGIDKIAEREEYLVNKAMDRLSSVPGMNIFHGENRNRYGIISFSIEGIHYNLLAALLNDRFGIQVRGGCSCAGTLGYDLHGLDESTSRRMTDKIDEGDLSCKPGWLRLSLHPTMSNLEIEFALRAIEQTVANIQEWRQEYVFDEHTAGWHHQSTVKSSASHA